MTRSGCGIVNKPAEPIAVCVPFVPDVCGRPRCSQPAHLRYLGTGLCVRHWLERCEEIDAAEELQAQRREAAQLSESTGGFGIFGSNHTEKTNEQEKEESGTEN